MSEAALRKDVYPYILNGVLLYIRSLCPEQTDLSPEREENMKKELRFGFDENDDVANVIDAILTAPGVHVRYSKEGSDGWISQISDEEMEDALNELPVIEQDIIERFFLKKQTLIDIAEDLMLPLELLMGHLKAIKVRLELYV